MSVTITAACISCGACLWECPTEAIVAGQPRPVVDAHRCVECYGIFPDRQCVVVCPARAIDVAAEAQEALRVRLHELLPGTVEVDTGYWTAAHPAPVVTGR